MEGRIFLEMNGRGQGQRMGWNFPQSDFSWFFVLLWGFPYVAKWEWQFYQVIDMEMPF